jgi:transposase
VSQIQALDRTQPGLPMKKGRAGTMTHDYKRNGTTTLFAALNMLDGKVIGTCMPRHRHREFLRFLKLIDQQIAEGLDLHLIVDNYATHKTPAVKRWLKAHPRFHLHFTPTSASWLNMVERFFAEITRNRIRRGAFKSVAELKAAIMQYLENHNADPKPFVWTKSASQILEKVARCETNVRVTTLVEFCFSFSCFPLLVFLNALPLSLDGFENFPDRFESCLALLKAQLKDSSRR